MGSGNHVYYFKFVGKEPTLEGTNLTKGLSIPLVGVGILARVPSQGFISCPVVPSYYIGMYCLQCFLPRYIPRYLVPLTSIRM